MKENWYVEWFDTPYYHALYQHRDEHEAQTFIDALVAHLPTEASWHFLDLACGRGRHALYLHQKGYRVTGLDLSTRNIQYAQQYAESGLDFQQGDMREPFGEGQYDCILNLFTSFGYFARAEDNQRALRQMKRALKPGGYLLLDFMNVSRVESGLVPKEIRQVGNWRFTIHRYLEGGYVVKQIEVEEGSSVKRFYERVQLLNQADFRALLAAEGWQLEATFGSYAMDAFDAHTSERLILKARS